MTGVRAYVAPVSPERGSFGQYLLDCGALSAMQLLIARGDAAHSKRSLVGVLAAQQAMPRNLLLGHYADWLNLPLLESKAVRADPGLLRQMGPQRCANLRIVPLGRSSGRVVLAAARPDQLDLDTVDLPTGVTGVDLLLADETAIAAAIARSGRAQLVRGAAKRVPPEESCRGWQKRRNLRLCIGILGLMLTGFLFWPLGLLTALLIWTCLTLYIASTLKLLALFAHVTRRDATPAEPDPPVRNRPTISILVPLYKEAEVAQSLIARLSQLTYPKALLDVVLVLEETDSLSRQALARVSLPHWMRVVIVPHGAPRTKPRAMNYALDFCRGEVIGIYDAEDAPAPDQLDIVARHFAAAPPEVACLQGVLDFYNPRQTWMARCFTIEYASWFRVILPGLRRLGFAIPLGGTTLFFRRDLLEKLGGWDAHNVTEDADLGFRLARHGYRTEMIPTTTQEEANCRLLPWIKQRSRWLKGYMVTYLVHMRHPRLLFRQLGAWQFLGFQLHFVTALSQFLLAPLLWSFWLLLLGLPHPLSPYVWDVWLQGAMWLFLVVEAVTLSIGLLAVQGRHHRHLIPWLPMMHLYFPLGVFAAYKALYELVLAPFYWDKTRHGISPQARAAPASGQPS